MTHWIIHSLIYFFSLLESSVIMLQLKCKIESVGEDSKTRCHKRLWHRVQWSHYRYQSGWWPLVGVQRNIVNVSVRWITWDNGIQATGHSPSRATTTTVCSNILHQLNFWSCSFPLKLLTLPLLHTMMELKQTDCFKLVHAAPLLFLTKEPKLRGGFFDHFGVFILVSSPDQWEEGVWGQAAGSQLGSFIPCLPPAPRPDIRRIRSWLAVTTRTITHFIQILRCLGI